jgi:hypothetical protein
MQILLKIEDLVQTLTVNNIKTVDDDDVWEIANLIRWLNQLFKEKFKIERFLFGEIYPNYYLNSPEFVVSLMEELGYDKSQNDDDSDVDSDDNTTINNESINDNNNKKTTNHDDSVISNTSTVTTNTNLNNSDSFDVTKHTIDNNDDDLLNESKRKKL